MSDQIVLNDSWKNFLRDEFEQPYFKSLKQFLLEEKKSGKIIYPPGQQIFSALDLTPLDQVKVVILGQDPYHGAGQAHGLCFSVNDGVRFPPSLQNIFKELKSDCEVPTPISGNLNRWAKQGVLLLNATLTVRKDEAGSHQKKGWESFTDKIIQTISSQQPHVVFILWGRYAQGKIHLIDQHKHCILHSAHPSPLSAYHGFFGSKPFSKTNTYLEAHGMAPIEW